MANPVEQLASDLSQLDKCAVCDGPIHDADREDGHCPHCDTDLSFHVSLRQSTLDVAGQDERNATSVNQFNSIAMDDVDIHREQEDQLREEERDLDYQPEEEGEEDDDEEDGGDSTVGTSGDRVASATSRIERCKGKGKGKEKASKPGNGKQVGKFASYKIKKRQLAPLKPGGKVRYQVCGMESVKVEMNDQRMKKILTLMAKHNNFATEDDLNDPEAMVDHFECLMILDEANTKNSHGKGSRYPRYLRDYVGPGKCFLYHSEIARLKQKGAHDFIEKWIRTEKIKTQNINKRPAVEAKPKDLEAKIRKLVGDHKHGIDDYLDLLDKLKSGEIKLPTPESSSDAGSPSSSSHGSSSGAALHRSSRSHVLADPGSPSAMIPGMNSDDDDDDDDEEAADADVPMEEDEGSEQEYAEEDSDDDGSD
jgi:hypothetical protein